MFNKKTIKLITLLLVILTFIGGCKKSVFKRHAKGHVEDITDGTPIPSAEVLIINEQAEIFGNRKQEELGSSKSDLNGDFEIEYKTNYDGNNFIYANNENYFNITDIDRIEVNASVRKSLEVKLTPKSFVKVRVELFDTTITQLHFSFDPASKSSEVFIFGKGITERTFVVRGNISNNYSYQIIYQNSTTVNKSGAIFCPKFDQPAAVLTLKF